jgi:hypothetical protein
MNIFWSRETFFKTENIHNRKWSVTDEEFTYPEENFAVFNDLQEARDFKQGGIQSDLWEIIF